MKVFQKTSILIILLGLTAAKCELPDTKQYADLTKEMCQSIRQAATQTIDFLEKGLSARKPKENEAAAVDESIEGMMNDILGIKKVTTNKENYPKILKSSWKTIFNLLEQMVSYADALASIKESGTKGKESFKNLATSLNGLATVAGFGTIAAPVGALGEFVYGKIAVIRASSKLEEVITASDDVIQAVATNLVSVLAHMEEVNNVAGSENFSNLSNSKDNERINNYFVSLVEKENVNVEKLTLINQYDNGDRSVLKYFVYKDPQSLDKLGLPDLQAAIKKIQEDEGLSPRDKLKKIASEAESTFGTQINSALNNHGIVNALKIDQRLKDIQSDLEFVRAERTRYQEQYDKIKESEKNIATVAKANQELIEKSTKAVKAWALNHHNMKSFFAKKQSLSFSTLQLYVEDLQELGTLVKNINTK